MQLVNFAVKCFIVTWCISYLLNAYYPSYEFLDATHRVNTVNGKSESYSYFEYNRGWNQ